MDGGLVVSPPRELQLSGGEIGHGELNRTFSKPFSFHAAYSLDLHRSDSPSSSSSLSSSSPSPSPRSFSSSSLMSLPSSSSSS